MKTKESESKKMKTNARNNVTYLPFLYLPNEVIVYNILTRLPLKSLHRFSCVCKLWLTVSGKDPDPEFVSKRMIHSRRNPLILGLFHMENWVTTNLMRLGWFEMKDRSFFKFISFDPSFIDGKSSDYGNFRSTTGDAPSFLVGYCNGLFCIRSISDLSEVTISGFEITNICTDEVLLLPPPPPLPPIAPPEIPQIVRYGFGFDPLNKQYKVLQLVQGVGQRCLVFTLGSSSSWLWREIPLPEEVSELLLGSVICDDHTSHSALYSMKALHWLFVTPVSYILSFDLHTEQFLVIPPPPQFPRNHRDLSRRHRYFFSEFQNRICCGFQCQEFEDEEEVEGFPTHLFWLLNDPFSCSDYTPQWGDFAFIFPPIFNPKYETELGLTSCPGHFVFYFYSRNDVLKFYHPHLSYSTFHDFGEDLSDNLPLFIHHVENLVSLRTLLPPAADEDEDEARHPSIINI